MKTFSSLLHATRTCPQALFGPSFHLAFRKESHMGRTVSMVVLLASMAAPAWAGTGNSGSGPHAAPPSETALRAYVASYASGAYAATPSFARQTGLACSACHTHYPELTAMGRAFKLNGYVFRRGGADSISAQSA